MGNHSTKHQNALKDRPKKNVHWKSAEPPAAPGKPYPVLGAQPEILLLKWDRPHTDGGSPIIGYLVEQRRVGSPTWSKATATLVPYPELSLSGLEPGWRYQFRVAAQNVVGLSELSPISDSLSVALQRNSTAAPQFLNELQDTTVMENDQCEFNVSVMGTPAPQINWFKDGFEIFSSRRTKIISDNGKSTLIFHQAALTDEGEIKCTATNRAGHVATRMYLNIEAPPKIRLPRQYEDGYLIEAGEVIKLKVGIAGRPVPSITWSHNGEIVENGGRFEITTNDKNSFLKIVKATRTDRGEYNVRAINKLGEFNASFLVTVTAKPNPPQNVRITMSLGKSVTLTWSEPDDDGGCKIGNYIVEYFRIGWDVWLKASATRQLTATLNDLIEGSEYKFRVKAESPYGLSEPSEESKILFVPDHRRGIVSPSRDSKDTIISPSVVRRNSDKKKVNQIVISEVPKNVELISQIYDNEAIARELNYGTKVDIVYKKKEVSTNLRRRSDDLGSRRDSQRISSEVLSKKDDNNDRARRQLAVDQNKIRNDAQNQLSLPGDDYVHTSNEFMLVLYDDDEKHGKMNEEKNQFDLDLKEAISPPPFSLSTPDLQNISAYNPFYPLRRSASSTELLYEKVMQRFYQAVELDKAEIERKRSMSTEPRSNSKLNEINHERSPRASGTALNTVENNWVRSDEEDYCKINTIEKAMTLQQKQKPSEPLESEPAATKWEDDHERDLRKEIQEAQRKRSTSSREPLPKALYEEDYTDSTASTASVSASASMESIEQFINSVRSASSSTTNVRTTVNDELETYHPRMEVRALSPYRTPEPGQAAVVLNKPSPLPDPDYVPKPILKRSSIPSNEITINEKVNTTPNVKPTPSKPEKRGFLQLFERKKAPSGENVKKSSNETTSKVSNSKTVSSSAASKSNEQVAEREKVTQQRQNSMEENKVVIDHYSDLVRELSSRAKPKVSLYMDSEALQQAELKAEIEEQTNTLTNTNATVPEQSNKIHKEANDKENKMQRLDADDDDNELQMQELAKKLNQFQETDDRSRASSVQKDLVEISVEHTKSISYSLREIKQDSISPKETVKNAIVRNSIEPNKTITSNGGGAITKRQVTSHIASVRSRPSESPMRSDSRTSRRSQSRSPVPMPQHRTSLTSTVLKVTRRPINDNCIRFDVDLSPSVSPPISPSLSPEPRCKTPEQLQVEAEINVKSSLSYTTDLAMFLLASWLYFFRDARYAIPILVLMVYRQVRAAFERKLQKWTKRKRD